jgi:hypothetical protein
MWSRKEKTNGWVKQHTSEEHNKKRTFAKSHEVNLMCLPKAAAKLGRGRGVTKTPPHEME